MEMVYLVSVVVGLLGYLLLRSHALRLLGWRCGMANVGGGDADGVEHGGVHRSAGNRGNDPGANCGEPRTSVGARFEALDILGGIALIGLLGYAFINGMDATISNMLSGLFGVLFGRSTKKNGK